MPPHADKTDPRVTRFIADATQGTGKVCRLTRLAVERHVHDLERATSDASYPYYFDRESAQITLDFCGLVRHWKGEWAGQVFEPRPDEAFLLWCLFGWKRKSDRTRRFRELLYEVAKKNGKTFMAAVIALLLLILDGEQGAEIYSTATKRDQAKLAWQDAAKIVKASPSLRSRITLPRGEYSYTMVMSETSSVYRALSSDDEGADGVMPHGVINDELHRQVNRGLYDVLKFGSRGRRQPLFGHFTTAGDELDTTLYGEVHDHAVAILEGEVDGPAAEEFLVLIFTLDEGDKWTDRAAWIKANPALGVNLRFEDLEKDFAEAIAKPASEASFKRLRLNVRTTSDTPWIRGEDWDACFDPELVGWPAETWGERRALGGFDMAQTTDLVGFDLVFPVDNVVAVRGRGWCPAARLEARGQRDRAPYPMWAAQGWLTPVEGEIIDEEWIEQELQHAATECNLEEICYDPAYASRIARRLSEAGITMVEVPQRPTLMTEPINYIGDLVATRRLRHDGNPLLKWCVLNGRLVEMPGGLKKVKKANYRARIDLAAAMLTAMRRVIDTQPGPPPPPWDGHIDFIGA